MLSQGRGNLVLVGTTKNIILQGSLDLKFSAIVQVSFFNWFYLTNSEYWWTLKINIKNHCSIASSEHFPMFLYNLFTMIV